MRWNRRNRPGKLIPRSQDEEDANAHGTDRKKVIQSSVFHRREHAFVAAILLRILATNSKRAPRFLISHGVIATRTHFHTLTKSFKQWLGSRSVISRVFSKPVSSGPVV